MIHIDRCPSLRRGRCGCGHPNCPDGGWDDYDDDTEIDHDAAAEIAADERAEARAQHLADLADDIWGSR